MVPVGITEWNFDPGGNTVLGSNATFMEEYTSAALSSMISARVDFAAQFDMQDFGGYGALDMFDMHNNDEPKAQFRALSDTVKQYRLTGRRLASQTYRLRHRARGRGSRPDQQRHRARHG